jgi:ubiquitin-like protein Pup
MSEQVRKSAKSDAAEDVTRETGANTGLAEKGKDLKHAMDDLLDEIDSVLEENAEEFVAGYVQRGGQ